LLSSDEKHVSTTNLLLASLLLSSGGNVVELEDKGRYTLVHLDLSGCSLDLLKNMSQKTTSLLEVMKTSDSIEEWEKFFSLSMIGRADREYRELKKLISTARNAQKK
jgi:hypothetical protein